tara:strand:- start:484 stop:1188 length:705 start_codon:yes stop_codon:yes gene_type:complete
MTNINQPKFEKARRVFDKVFNKYDFMNDLMSLGIHRLWKERLIDWMNPKKNDHLIDVASGTGDIAKVYARRNNNMGQITCVEPNKFMLEKAQKKLKNYKNINWICSPAEKLPIKDEQFDIYSVSFGIRNFSNIDKSLSEARRVLKTGGRIFCLEFSKVDNEILKQFYKMYSKSIPIIGKYVVGSAEPYEYLTKTIDEFYNQRQLADLFRKNGFEDVEYRNLTGGIAAIHSGWKI